MTAPAVRRPKVAELLGVDSDERRALKVIADFLATPGLIVSAPLERALAGVDLGITGVGQMLGDLVGHDDDCPECPHGLVETVGSRCRETGHQAVRCDAGCGWSA